MIEVIGAKIYRILFLCNKKNEQKKIMKKYHIDPSVKIGDSTIIYDDGNIKIGKGTYIGSYCRFQCNIGNRITIGKNCAIGHFVRMNTLEYQNGSIPSNKIYTQKDITIGDNCWICSGSVITKGVTIGNDVVVGANAVVTKDIPSFSVVGGVPAQIIRHKKRSE